METERKIYIMKKRILAVLTALISIFVMVAQNSAPAPGSGGSYMPGGGGFGAPAPTVGPPPGPYWGPGPAFGWSDPYYSPSVIVNAPSYVNSGVEKVIACGYDAQGVWQTIPLVVSYNYTGARYNVMVLNAYNPWTDMWNRGVDQPAYNTSYFLRGNTYDFYTNLSTGTYYFNL